MTKPRSIPFILLNTLRLTTAAFCLLIAATGLATIALTTSGHECSLIASLPSTSAPDPTAWARLSAGSGWLSITYLRPHNTTFPTAVVQPLLTKLPSSKWNAHFQSNGESLAISHLILGQWSHPTPSSERLALPGPEARHFLHSIPASLFLIPALILLLIPRTARISIHPPD